MGEVEAMSQVRTVPFIQKRRKPTETQGDQTLSKPGEAVHCVILALGRYCSARE